MTPASLQNWDIPSLLNILTKGSYESEDFELKQQLPHRQDKPGKDRLCKTCCAFANSEGGFIVFGVADDRSAAAADRLIGLAPDLDFAEHFGNYPANCHPSVAWELRNPPLVLANGNLLPVVFIPRSWNGPHCVGDAATGWIFPKRTNKGNEGMSYEEIRTHFLGYYEKRLKLQLLRSELANIMWCSGQLIIPEQQRGTSYGLQGFTLSVVESVLSDSYTILATASGLLGTLTQLRNTCRVVENQLQIFYNTALLSFTNKEAMVREHNERVAQNCQVISRLCEEAMRLLEPLAA